ncbi:fibroblast growth factor receptor 2-like isoform X2 [Montipora capricornis]|uniref:fibroblast growth factor receptor 2-like isoform X2 n=1 Tax=Montipora capricornis TaxID=246305 RepID=UPI0035F21A38
MDYARSNIILLICLVCAATFPDVEALTTSRSAPSFTPRPQNKSVNVNSSVTSKCEASGVPQLSITWVKYADSSQTAITTGGRFNVSSGNLDIIGVQLVDAGQYGCIAHNMHGKLVADAFLTTSTYGPPIWYIKQHNVTLYDGQQNYKLDCQAYGFPPARHRWTKNGSQINDEDVSVGRNDLSFRVARTRHTGWYTCIANNMHGTITQSVYVEVVNGSGTPLSVVAVQPFINTTEGSDVKLECIFNGSVTSGITWYKDRVKVTLYKGDELIGNNKHKAFLTLTQVAPSVAGNYVCKGSSPSGSAEASISLVVKGQPQQRENGSSSTGALVGGVNGGVVFVALVIVLVFILRRQKRKSWKTPQKQLPEVVYAVVDQENEIYATTDATDANVDTTVNPQEISHIYSYASIKLDAAAAMATGQLEYASVQKPKQWELPKSNVRLDKKLGSGHFGQVMKGFLKTKQGTRVVAVKMLKENADQQQKKEFLAELELMKTMAPHPNIVGLVGCCSKPGEPFIIVEYCSLGNLRDFLRSSHGRVIYANLAANSLTLTCLDLLSFAWQCARGMSYLASQKVVHRDLAARNILVDKGHVCKIADFGLARDIYEKKQYLKLGEADLPLRWMAIESIFQGITTTLSDVWSFGILLWEIVTLGANPYPAMKRDDLIEQLRVGYRMPKPPFCSDELYAIMWQCWQTDPESRPTFLELGKTLHRLKTAKTLPIDLGNYDRSYINATEDDL